MQLLEEYKKKKRIKLTDDELFELASADRDEAEKYFDANIADAIILRYNLLHSNKDYYKGKFERLSKLSSFSASDVKDAVEWIMPSLTEVYFGADKIIGVFGRTPDDDPSVLEKIMKYQVQTQNEGYVITDQWIRDGVESGLGVQKLDWEIIEERKLNWYQASAEEFYAIPPEEVKKTIKKVEALPDGSYKLLVREKVRIKDQARMRNIRPGEFIFLPEKDGSGRNVFECYRHYALYDDIRKMGKVGIFRNTEDDFPFIDTSSSDSNSMDTIFDAIRNYSGEDIDNSYHMDASAKIGQEGRRKVVVYECYGKYDVDGDGLLEDVIIIICNGRVLFSAINEFDRNPFMTISFFANSYQKWKQGVADLLQDIQDLKTALIRQIIVNTAINNDRVYGVDKDQPEAIKDIEGGKKRVRMDLKGGKRIQDVLQALPQYELSRETMPLIEMATGWSEQRTGITRYNQGLDADSLNKTATGISKIMAASQQKLRKMSRDGAENGIVPFYKHLIALNKRYLDKEFVFRITNEYYEFKPDDIKGEFDVQVTSNIGLQDKQLTIQNLMVTFKQILPDLLKTGAASPMGLFETAKQIVEEMGFNNADKFIGSQAGQIAAQQGQQQAMAILQQLPMVIGSVFKSANIPPEVAAQITQGVMAGMQQVASAPQQPQMQIEGGQPA